MTDKEFLEAVRAKIAMGWTQGHAQRGGDYCLFGAAMAVSDELAAQDRLDYLLDLTPDSEDGSLIAWNDAEGRTQSQVLSRIDEAIARLSE